MSSPRFDDADLAAWLAQADDAALDALNFGAIGFGRDGRITRYNAWESRAAGFAVADVRGQDLFVELAPCMNNYLVAARFEDAAAAAASPCRSPRRSSLRPPCCCPMSPPFRRAPRTAVRLP